MSHARRYSPPTRTAAPAHTCPVCGKRAYQSKGEAKSAVQRLESRKGRLNVYRCGDFWHMGHLPSAVTRGVVPRSRLSPAVFRGRATA